MKIKAGNYCPLLQKECIGLQCAWITQIRGMDPQTGEDVDEWDCAIKWLPVLLIENTNTDKHTNIITDRQYFFIQPGSVLHLLVGRSSSTGGSGA